MKDFKVAMVTRDFGKGGGIYTNMASIAKFYPKNIDIVTKGLGKDRMGLKNIINVKSYSEMKKVLKRYDILHFHHFPEDQLIWFMKNKKIVHTWHGVLPISLSGSFKKKLVLFGSKIGHNLIWNKCDKIISVSEYVEDMLGKHKGKSTVIRTGIDTKKFKPPKKKPKKFKVLYAGDMKKKKRMYWVEKIAKSLPDVEFILVGGEYNTNLKNVKVIGWTDKIEKYYDQTHLLIRPSFYESQGIPVLESMAAGNPVIANSACSSFSEIISNGKDGFVVPPEKFVEKIKFFRDNKSEWKKFSKRARKKSEKYSLKETAKQTMKLYKKLI